MKIPMSERAPVEINEADWPIIAQVRKATTTLTVRRHADGRCLVYGGDGTGRYSGWLVREDEVPVRMLGTSIYLNAMDVLDDWRAQLPAEAI